MGFSGEVCGGVGTACLSEEALAGNCRSKGLYIE